MRLSRAGNRRNSGYLKFFDQKPAIRWNKKTKEISLAVNRVRGVSGDPSLYNFRIFLTVPELQEMIGSLVSEESIVQIR